MDMSAIIFGAAIYCDWSFFIIKNNDYINFYIKMNITNILVDRATSVISSALCGGGGA